MSAPKGRILIHLGSQDGEWRKAALQSVADMVITDDEAGQRGEKLSTLFQMIADAAIGNTSATAALLLKIKKLTGA